MGDELVPGKAGSVALDEEAETGAALSGVLVCMKLKFGPVVRMALALLFAASFGVPAADAKTPREIAIEGIEAYNNGIYNLAFPLLKSAADLGDSDAEVNLGYMYARGQGTRIDQAEAMRLYRLSADSGNGEGMNAIAYKYTYGTGVPIDMRWRCAGIVGR